MLGIESAEDRTHVNSICEILVNKFNESAIEIDQSDLILDQIYGHTRFRRIIILRVFVIAAEKDTEWVSNLEEWVKNTVYDTTEGRWKAEVEIIVRSKKSTGALEKEVVE